MTLELRQSTAVSVILHDFVDKDDALTPETGLAGTMSVQLSKNSGAKAARNSATAITHLGNGDYAVPLNTTDTGTLGRLEATVDDVATHLPVTEKFEVVAQQYWDSKYGSDKLQVDVREVGGTSVTGPNDLKADTTGLSTFDETVDTVTVGAVNVEGIRDFFTVNPSESPASGSVVEQAQGTATTAVVQTAMTNQGYTTTRAAKLDNLDAAVSSVSAGGSGGSGAVQVTLQSKVGGVPADNVQCWLTLSADGTQKVAGDRYTNANGEVTFMIDYGVNYYWWQAKSGATFTNPTTVRLDN